MSVFKRPEFPGNTGVNVRTPDYANTLAQAGRNAVALRLINCRGGWNRTSPRQWQMGIMPPERRDGQQGQRFPRVQPREVERGEILPVAAVHSC